MFTKFAPKLLVLALTVVIPTQAKAAIEAFSNLSISDFGLFVDTGGGVAGAQIEEGVHFQLVAPATFSSNASADLFSVPGGPTSTGVLPNFDPSVGLNTLQASEGAGAPGENVFTNAGVPSVARADTNGSGTVIAGTPYTFGASAQTVAEVQLSTGMSSTDSGRADSAVTSTANFTIIPMGSLDIVGIFDASRHLIADLTPAPPGIVASADTSFNISVTNAITNATVFEWGPDGSLGGGIVGGTEISDPFDLNGAISGFPGFSNEDLDPLDEFRATLSLDDNTPYSFTIEHSSAVTATTLGVIPEPTAIVIWSIFSVTAMVGARPRRSRS